MEKWGGRVFWWDFALICLFYLQMLALGPDDPLWSLSNLPTLWFCYSVVRFKIFLQGIWPTNKISLSPTEEKALKIVLACEYSTSKFLSNVKGISLSNRTIFTMYHNIPSLPPLFKIMCLKF